MPIEGLLMSSDSERPQPNFGALDVKVGSTSIGNLPPEILGLIFALVHEDLKAQKGALFEGMRALSTTCKDWNQLASSIPELWSFIHIVVNFDQEGMHMTTHSHLSAITTFLKLSRDVPLSLTLEIYGSPRRIETSISDRILKHITAALYLLSNDFHRSSGKLFACGRSGASDTSDRCGKFSVINIIFPFRTTTHSFCSSLLKL